MQCRRITLDNLVTLGRYKNERFASHEVRANVHTTLKTLLLIPSQIQTTGVVWQAG